MPTYVYRCEKCNEVFEAKQGYEDPPLEDCPADDCSGGKVRRVIQPTPHFFKREGKQREKQADGSSIWS